MDVFLSYNTKDRESVVRIAETLRAHKVEVWLDVWNIAPGTSIAGAIDEALKNCRSVAAFISPNNMGQWQEPEIEVAIKQKIHRKIPVMAVLLPGVPEEVISQLPALLTSNRYVDYRGGLDENKPLYDLLWGIKQVPPPASVMEPPPPTVPPAPVYNQRPGGDDVVDKLVHTVKSQNITFFLGSGVYCGEQLPNMRACKIAHELLLDLRIIDDAYANLLPPVDVAGMYYAVTRGETSLEGKILDILENSPGTTPTHALLVELLKLLTSRPNRRMSAKSQHLIVTTNVDLIMERTLLRAGVPFTRIVQHRSGQQIDVNVYASVELAGNTIRLMPGGGPGATVECEADDTRKLDGIIEHYGRRIFKKQIDPRDRRVTREGEETDLDDKTEPMDSLDLRGMTEPILYKFLGSQDITNSLVLSAAQHFEFARTILQQNCVPEKITALIGNSQLLFLGLSFMDPEFRLTYNSLLHKTLEVANRDSRFALQLPPDRFESDVYRRMEIGIWDSIKDAWMRDMQIKTLEEDDVSFLQRLLKAVRERTGRGT